MDLYETLGVDRDADMAAIRKAYRSKAQETHPDKNGGSTEAFQAVQLAYQVLYDPERRKRYDETGNTDPVDGRSITDLAIEAIQASFRAAAKKAEWRQRPYVADIRRGMGEIKQRLERDLATLKTVMNRLEKTVPDGGDDENIFAEVVEQEKADIERALAQTTKELGVLVAALELLEAYKDNVTPEQAMSQNMVSQLQAQAARGLGGFLGGTQT